MAEIGKHAKELGGEIVELDICDLVVCDRFRTDYGNIEELKLSLTTYGQLQNIIVVRTTDGYKLLAGGRRTKAMQELEWKSCKALVFSHELSELEILEIEYEENARRKDLDWREDVALRSRIHEMKVSIEGKKVSSMSDGQSIRKTAEEIGISHTQLSKDILLHKAQELVPELFEGAKNKKEAHKVLARIETSIRREDLADKIKEEASRSNLQTKELIDRFIVGDFFERVLDIPDESIDFFELDPPYAINLASIKSGMRDSKYSTDEYREVPEADYMNFMERVLTQCYRVLKPDSWGVVWHAQDWQEKIWNLIYRSGFVCSRITGKWIKPSGQCNHPDLYLANCIEEFFYVRKGRPSLVRQGRTNAFIYDPVPNIMKIHPTERPLQLISELLSIFCMEGYQILVPFAGSGKTIIAAEKMGMKAIGFDLSEEYKNGFTILADNLRTGKEIR